MGFENPISIEQKEELIIDKKIGAAKLLAALDNAIRKNSEIDAKELDDILENFTQKFRLDNDQQNSFKIGIKKYFKKHAAIVNDLEKYKKDFGDNWKRELYKYCFGGYPEGVVEIRPGAMTLYFMCESLKDYALASNQSEEAAAESFGYRKSPLDEQPEELIGALIIEYSGHSKHKEKCQQTKLKKSMITETHEEQHVIFDLLDDELDLGPLSFADLNETSALPEVRLSVVRYLNLRRQEMERAAKNEIIAYWRDGEKSINEIGSVILEPGGLYDIKNNESEELLSDYLISRFGANYKSLTPQLNINNIWHEQCAKFNTNIQRALEVIKDIEIYNSDKKIEYLYLLSIEKLDKWTRTYQLVKARI
jgi:hypothetical protein